MAFAMLSCWQLSSSAAAGLLLQASSPLQCFPFSFPALSPWVQIHVDQMCHRAPLPPTDLLRPQQFCSATPSPSPSLLPFFPKQLSFVSVPAHQTDTRSSTAAAITARTARRLSCLTERYLAWWRPPDVCKYIHTCMDSANCTPGWMHIEAYY